MYGPGWRTQKLGDNEETHETRIEQDQQLLMLLASHPRWHLPPRSSPSEAAGGDSAMMLAPHPRPRLASTWRSAFTEYAANAAYELVHNDHAAEYGYPYSLLFHGEVKMGPMEAPTSLRHVGFPVMFVSLLWMHFQAVQHDMLQLTTFCLYGCYVGLYVLIQYILKNAASVDPDFMASSALATVLLVKLFASCSMFFSEYVNDDMGFSPYWIEDIFASRSTLAKCAGPAILFAMADLIFLSGQLQTPLAEVQVLYAGSLPLVAYFTMVLFGRPVPKGRQVGLGLILCGILLIELQRGAEALFNPVRSVALSYTLVTVQLLFGAACSSFATVMNEYNQKSSSGSTNMQSATMHFMGLMTLCSMSMFSTKVGLRLNQPRDTNEAAVIILYAAWGIVTTYFLKTVGSIWHDVGACSILVADAYLDAVSGTTMSDGYFLSVFMVFVGMGVLSFMPTQGKGL